MLTGSGLSIVALAIEVILALISLSGLVYMLLALWGARDFVRSLKPTDPTPFAPAVSILKPLKGIDARMYAGLRSHCEQQYAGEYEILFGVSSLDDPAVPEIERLQSEFPDTSIRVIECPERLGTSGKVSNLIQMLRVARHEYIVINDSDIRVSRRYLENVLRGFREERVGLVTAPYLGVTTRLGPGCGADGGATVWARLEALGISTDFFPGVLTARLLEGGIHFGLGSTLATSKTVLDRIGGLEPLVDHLADDYELGHRIAQAGYRVELCGEIVETTVPAYRLKGFWEHQMRWARSMRDSRELGYLGLGVTYCLPWATLTVLASGFALWSLALLSIILLARVAVALTSGVGILRDGQVLRDLWLLPVRDCFGLLVWLWSFTGETVVWRGEVFRLKDGVISPVK